jgi:hypothetical protein
MVRSFVLEPTHPYSNPRFDMNVIYLWLIIFLVVGDISFDSETLLMIDFINLEIKSVQSVEVAHRSRMCVRVFIGNTHICMSICICTVFLNKD